VRVFLTWEDFQPDPEGVKCCALARLTALCDAVAAEGLRAIVTLNMGHWGGHNWVPAWMLDGQAASLTHPTVSNRQRVASGYRDPYTDPLARRAAVRLVRAVSKTLSDHQAVWAYDIANEANQFASSTTVEILKDWYQEIVEALRSFDQTHEITCGFGMQNLLSNPAFYSGNGSDTADFASIQLDANGLALARGHLDSDILPFSCSLAAAMSHKPSFLLDWNVATQATTPVNVAGNKAQVWVAGEDAAAGFAEELLPKLLDAGALGALVGNFSDIDPCLYDLPPYDTREVERSRGLLHVDGTLKPHGQVIRRFAESNPLVQPKPAKQYFTAISNDDFAKDPYEQTRRLYGSFSSHSTGLVTGQLG